MIGLRSFFIGITEDTQPVKLGGSYKFAEFIEILLGLAWKTYDEGGPEGKSRNSAAHLFDGFQKNSGACAPFHPFKHRRRRMLERDIDVGTDFFMRSHRIQELARDLVGIGIEEPHPRQIVDLRQSLQQQGKPVFQSQVFAVTGCVLADERDLPYTTRGESHGFGNDRFEMAGAKLPTKLRGDAKTAGMIAPFRNLDVGR